MRHGFHAAGFERAGGHQSVHADASHGAGIDVDGVDFARSHDFIDLLENSVERKSFGRIDFHAYREFFSLQFFPEFAFRVALRDRRGLGGDRNGMRGGARFRRMQGFHRVRHGANVRRGGAAAAAENAHAERGRFAREERKIFGRRFRVNDAVAFAFRKAGVGHSADAQILDPGEFFENRKQRLRPEGAVRADHLDICTLQLCGGVGRAQIAVRRAFFRIGDLRDDWQSGE